MPANASFAVDNCAFNWFTCASASCAFVYAAAVIQTTPGMARCPLPKPSSVFKTVGTVPVNVLILDEPTNHLDLPTIEWLENYLSDYQGTYVIVSHDRFFLDKTVNRIAEVAHQQLYHYKGNFSDYLDQKDERDEMLQRRFENQQTYIKQQMQFISRFRYKASKSTAVQSRVKMLNKIDRIELKDKERGDFDIKFNKEFYNSLTPKLLEFKLKWNKPDASFPQGDFKIRFYENMKNL